MAEGRSGSSNSARSRAGRRGRGFVMVLLDLPRFVIRKKLANGKSAFYFNIPKYWRTRGCTISNEPLGNDYETVCSRAAALNGLFDEWGKTRRGEPIESGLSLIHI